MRLTNLAIVLGAALIPSLALADDPYTTTDDSQQQQQPMPQQPTTTNTTTTVAPAPTPVVVVNPQNTEPTPRTTVVEPQYETVYDNYNAPVFTTGALTFLGSYGASVIYAGSSEHAGADRLYVPVVGPWLALNDWGDCPITNENCDNTTTAKVLLVADGVFQAAGVITMLDGILEPSSHRAVMRTAKVDTKVHVSPTHNGFAVFGHF
jgi:hypothetical protein